MIPIVPQREARDPRAWRSERGFWNCRVTQQALELDLCQPKNDNDFSEPDTILLHLDSGLWVWQCSSAPEGAHGIVGVYIEPDPPEYEMEMVDYWNTDEA